MIFYLLSQSEIFWGLGVCAWALCVLTFLWAAITHWLRAGKAKKNTHSKNPRAHTSVGACVWGRDNIFSIYISFFAVRQMFWPGRLAVSFTSYLPALAFVCSPCWLSPRYWGKRSKGGTYIRQVLRPGRKRMGVWEFFAYFLSSLGGELQHFLCLWASISGPGLNKRTNIYKFLFLSSCFFLSIFSLFLYRSHFCPGLCFFHFWCCCCCIILFRFYVCSIVLNYLCLRKIFKALPNAKVRAEKVAEESKSERERERGKAAARQDWREIRTDYNKKQHQQQDYSQSERAKLLFITQQHQSVKESATIPTAICLVPAPHCCRPASLHKLFMTFSVGTKQPK